ncbi:MAG: hypothetical protein ACFB6S_14695 [Geminicoccaceae bacterium]
MVISATPPFGAVARRAACLVALFGLIGCTAIPTGDGVVPAAVAPGEGRAPSEVDVAPIPRPPQPIAQASAPERLIYSPPARGPGDKLARLVDASSFQVWDNMLETFETLGFEFSMLDERNGVMIAVYSGAPRNFIDCGGIVAERKTNRARRLIDADDAEAVFGRRERRRTITVQRQLQLDARVVVNIEPAGNQARVEAETTYVVTKLLDVFDRRGQWQSNSSESVLFTSGDRAQFSKGTICQPTGGLERAALVNVDV